MDIASVIKNTRNNAGLTRKQLAEALEVSEKSVRNWEDGSAKPDGETLLKMFFACNAHLEHIMLKLKYPDVYGGLDEELTDESAKQMLITYVRSELSSDNSRRLLYSLLGEHGSDTGAQINLACAYNHLTMEDKYDICKLIMDRYMLRKEQGRLINMDKNVTPDLVRLQLICDEVRDEITGKSGYGRMQKE